MLSDEDKQWITRQFEQFVELIAQSEERTMARIERVETSLLTEFHKWASPLEMRVRSHASTLRAL
jgi:hypothetical protein